MGTNLRPLAWLAVSLTIGCGHDAAPMMSSATAAEDAGANDAHGLQPSGSLNTSSAGSGAKANGAGSSGGNQSTGGKSASTAPSGGRTGSNTGGGAGGAGGNRSSAGAAGASPAANGGRGSQAGSGGQAGSSQAGAGQAGAGQAGTGQADNTHHSDSRTCSAVAACGGDVSGTWQLSSICYVLTGELLADCADATAWFESDVMGGSASFDQSGQFSLSTDENFTLFETIPLSCLNGADCSALATDGTTCTTTASDCMCAHPGHNGGDTPEMNAYMLNGNMLTLQGDTSGTYCVQGDRMYFAPTSEDMSMPMMNSADLVVSPQFVFVKN